MNQQPLVTIGIPVYNVEPYVEKCLLSVLNQTYQQLEILVVDDLGTDRSMQLVEQLQQSHPSGQKIRIVTHTCNKGLGEARNSAIDEAKGKYLCFVDSDDYIEPQTIELLVKEAEANEADAVFASSRKVVYGTNEEQPTFVYRKREVLVGRDVFAHYLCQDLRWHIGINAWNILFLVGFLQKYFRVVEDRAEPLGCRDDLVHANLSVAVAVNCLEGSLVEFESRDRAAQDRPHLAVKFAQMGYVFAALDFDADFTSHRGKLPGIGIFLLFFLEHIGEV